MNNLIFLPSREGHLKCGVIDYQNSFWGESSWDLFSLLEDSRIFFTDQYNAYFMNYFYSHSNQLISLKLQYFQIYPITTIMYEKHYKF